MKTIQKQRSALAVTRIRSYVIDGKKAARGDLEGQAFIVGGAGLPEKETAYGFSTEEAFLRWAAGTRQADLFARAVGTIKLGQQLEGTEIGERAVARAEAETKRILAELEQLSRTTGLPIESPEFFVQAASPRSILEPPVFDPALLFDRVTDPGLPPVFGGAVVPVLGTIPTFGRFNDRASGAQVFGACTLHDRTFFRGAAAFMIGSASFVLSDLAFDNRAASGIAL